MSFVVAVIRMNGEEILPGEMVHGNDKVDVLVKAVEDALGGGERVQLCACDRELLAGACIKEFGLRDGDVVTAVTKPMPVPAVLWAGGRSAELKADGSVDCHGGSDGDWDFSKVKDQLTSDVHSIYSTGHAFAALKIDGSVVTWGDINYGGLPIGGDDAGLGIMLEKFGFDEQCEARAVISRLTQHLGQVARDVKYIRSTYGAFAALRVDGSVVAWGGAGYGGGGLGYPSVSEWGKVQDQLTCEVHSIYSIEHAFAALKTDGSVVAWGGAPVADYSSVQVQLAGDVQSIHSTKRAFAALKADCSVVVWGSTQKKTK